MISLEMSVRNVDTTERIVEGMCVPYNETTYAVPIPGGERIVRGAFDKSIRQTGERVMLFVEHQHDRGPVGRSVAWDNTDDGLRGRFRIRASEYGDQALGELADGYLPFLSVGFSPLQERKAADGVQEVVEARLMEVSACSMGAYAGALVESVRSADDDEVARWLAAIRKPMPEIDLSPIARRWG